MRKKEELYPRDKKNRCLWENLESHFPPICRLSTPVGEEWEYFRSGRQPWADYIRGNLFHSDWRRWKVATSRFVFSMAATSRIKCNNLQTSCFRYPFQKFWYYNYTSYPPTYRCRYRAIGVAKNEYLFINHFRSNIDWSDAGTFKKRGTAHSPEFLEVLNFWSRIVRWKENRDGEGEEGGLTLLNASFPLLFSSTHTSAGLATDFLTWRCIARAQKRERIRKYHVVRLWVLVVLSNKYAVTHGALVRTFNCLCWVNTFLLLAVYHHSLI